MVLCFDVAFILTGSLPHKSCPVAVIGFWPIVGTEFSHFLLRSTGIEGKTLQMNVFINVENTYE